MVFEFYHLNRMMLLARGTGGAWDRIGSWGTEMVKRGTMAIVFLFFFPEDTVTVAANIPMSMTKIKILDIFLGFAFSFWDGIKLHLNRYVYLRHHIMSFLAQCYQLLQVSSDQELYDSCKKIIHWNQELRDLRAQDQITVQELYDEIERQNLQLDRLSHDLNLVELQYHSLLEQTQDKDMSMDGSSVSNEPMSDA